MNTNIKIHQLIVTFSHLLYIEQLKKNGKNQVDFQTMWSSSIYIS